MALIAAGCSSVQIRATSPLAGKHRRVKSVAVTRLSNLTEAKEAASTLSLILSQELTKRNQLQITEAFDAAPGVQERWTASKLGQELKVDAVLVGVVTAFEYGSGSSKARGVVRPIISMDLRLVSASTGEVLWAAGVHAQRDQVWTFDSISLQELGQEAAEETLDELMSSLGYE